MIKQTTLTAFRRWLIWFLPTLFMFYQYGIHIVPSIKIAYLHEYYKIDDFKIALLNVSYVFPYLLMQIPAGFLIDHFDVRKILTTSMLLYTLGTFSIYLSDIHHNYLLYIIGRLIMGFAASTGFLSSVYLARIWLSEQEFKIAVSLTSAFAILGVLFIGLLFGILALYMPWHEIILANVIFCIFLSITIWCYIKDHHKENYFDISIIKDALLTTVKNKNLWLSGVIIAGLISNIAILTNTWRIAFLENIYHLQIFTATIFNGLSIIGFVLGAIFYGILATKLEKFTKIIFYSSILLFFILTSCHYFVIDIAIKNFLYFIIGFLTGSVTLVYIFIKKTVPEDEIAIAIGLVNTIQLSLGMILQLLVGELMFYTHENYILANTPVIIVLFFSMCSAWLLYRKS